MSNRYSSQPLDDLDYLDDKINSSRLMLLVFNVLGFFISLTTFSICIWVRFDLDFWEFVEEIQWYTYWHCIYVVMVTMIFGLVNHLYGVFGIWTESETHLSVHWILIALLMILQFASAICICIYGVEESDILRRDLHETFIRLVMRWDEDPRASRIMRKIQEYVGCCGADGSDDYIQYFKPVPDECRDRITGVEYSYGCEQQLAWWLEPWTATIAGVCVYQMATSFFGIWVARRLIHSIRKYNHANGGY
ncbi:tetraspanin-2A [Lepeophtheirus salmonis]|uniref:Tetraspanin n=1 Tax=Lepeophtheirus salmonis TaxID=72036 RepID=A0A0K2TE64_LEPSM|nr:tetraspanin-2A-like [Lepeophtheirus salmonis]